MDRRTRLLTGAFVALQFAALAGVMVAGNARRGTDPKCADQLAKAATEPAWTLALSLTLLLVTWIAGVAFSVNTRPADRPALFTVFAMVMPMALWAVFELAWHFTPFFKMC